MMSTSRKSLADFPQAYSLVDDDIWHLFVGYSTRILLASPSGLGSKFLTPLLSSIFLKASDGASTVKNNPQKAIALLTAFYLFSVYTVTGIMSSTGQLVGNKAGYKNKEPRLTKRNLPSRLPHRMVATHEALLEISPAYAVTPRPLAASLTSGSTPVPINALLHIFFKLVPLTST